MHFHKSSRNLQKYFLYFKLPTYRPTNLFTLVLTLLSYLQSTFSWKAFQDFIIYLSYDQ